MVDQESFSKATDRKKTGLDLKNSGCRNPTQPIKQKCLGQYTKMLPLLRGCCHGLTACVLHQTLLPTEHLLHSPPQRTAGQNKESWKIQALPSGVGWDTSPWKGWKKILLIYTLGLPEPYTLGRSLAGAQRDQVHHGLNTHQHLHHTVLQRFRSAGFTGLQTNSQRWGDTADGDCQLSDPNWFAIPSAEFWLLGLYQAFNWMQETL